MGEPARRLRAPIDASSTSLAVPPHTEPDSLTTVVTLPSVVIVPTQEPPASVALSWGPQASAARATTDTATIERRFMRRKLRRLGERIKRMPALGRWSAADAEGRAELHAEVGASRQSRQRGRACASAHVLFTPGDEGSAREGDSGAGWSRRSGHNPAVHAPVAGCGRRGDSAAGRAGPEHSRWRNTGEGRYHNP